jgi:DNA polymerase elongation subunit (family B)
VYDRFYIGDKKKRYFGHRIHSDGEDKDDMKVRGFETRQGDWPQPVRDFQEELMRARLAGDSTAPIISEARSRLESGEWDSVISKSTTLTKPIEEYKNVPIHARAAQAIRAEHGRQAVKVGDKVDYIKYGDATGDFVHVYRGELGKDFRPNEGYCHECGEVVRTDDGHPHGTEDWPRLRESHYGYLWRNLFESVMDSIDVSQGTQTGLDAFC